MCIRDRLHASAGLSEANGCYYLSGMVINIDERKNFEQQLLWSEKRFQIAIEQTSINVWEYDLKTRSILQTDKSYQTFGIGKVCLLYTSSEDSSVSPQSSLMVSLPTNTLKTAQEAAEAQGEGTVQFIERAISMQIERDKVQRIINKQSKKGGE